MDNIIIILIVACMVIISYVIFIFNGKYSYNQWWFGLNRTSLFNIPFLYWFAVTSFLAAVGFVYVMWYYKAKLEDELTEKQYDKIRTEIVIALVASVIWTPAVYYSLKYKQYKNTKHFFKTLAMLSLGVTAGASTAAAYFINDYSQSSTYKTIALVAYSLFIFHTGIVDFGLWNVFYYNNL